MSHPHDMTFAETTPLREHGVWLDLRHLHLLVEVALGGSLTAAADALSYTPSAVSRQLTSLQRDVGITLVTRDGRNLRLTRAGWELAMRGSRILHEARSTHDALMRHRGQRPELAPGDAARRLQDVLVQLDEVHAKRSPRGSLPAHA
jgi:DNA-binding transcriptional LysR family regulator